jgi:multiple sugar transport system ATP-binding protein
MADIALDRVTKTFGDVVAVDDVSLDIADGEFIVLVGPSGCGKSTLLRMIAGLEEVDVGQVLIGGRDVTELAPRRRDVAMVFQTYALFPHLSAAENIGFGLEAREVPKADRRARVAEAAQLVGCSTLLDRRPAELSGGERQRVALARALAVEPALLLVDEPTAELDEENRDRAVGLLRDAADRGAAVVVATHDPEVVELCDRVVRLVDGRPVELDPNQVGGPVA